MVSRTKGIAFMIACLTLGAAAVAAQGMPNPQEIQAQVQKIVQARPREAEAAARAFLHLVAQDAVDDLDSLKAKSVDAYWMEVGQLTVQFEVVQNLVRRDSARADLVAKMFGSEVYARALQRGYRNAGEPQRAQIRRQLEQLMDRHFEMEDKLREREVADIERRLAEVRAESLRRREKRAEFVKWAVDDIIRDATRPQ